MSKPSNDGPDVTDRRPGPADGPGPPRTAERRSADRRPATVRALVLVVAVVVGALAGAAYGLVTGPTYRSTAYVAVTSKSQTDGLQRASSFAQAYGRIATELSVVEPASRQLGLTPADISGAVLTQTSPDAPLIELAGVADDPGRATDAANAVADSLVTYANARQVDTGVSLAVFAPAVRPLGPASASVELMGLVGGAGGLLVAALGLFAASQRAGGGAPAPNASASTGSGVEPRRNGSADPSHLTRR